MREEYEAKIKDMIEYNREQFRIADERINKIEEMIKKEIHDRVVETDEDVYPVRAYLNSK